jgi:hypothetical protein
MRAHEFVTEEINPEVVEPDFYAETNVDLPGVGPLKFVAKNIKPRPYTPQFLVKVFLPNGQSIGYFRFLIMDYEEPTGFRFLSTFKKFKDPYVIGANVSVWNEFQRKGIARAVYQWIKSMGNDLRPSPTQTDAGRSMWRGFEKAPLEERKKRRKKSRWAFSGPGGWYGYYYGGSGESEAGGDGGGESVEENFADGKVKGKSRPGRVKRSGASCAGSVTDLRARAKKYGGEKGKMYHWCANMKSGRKK